MKFDSLQDFKDWANKNALHLEEFALHSIINELKKSDKERIKDNYILRMQLGQVYLNTSQYEYSKSKKRGVNAKIPYVNVYYVNSVKRFKKDSIIHYYHLQIKDGRVNFSEEQANIWPRHFGKYPYWFLYEKPSSYFLNWNEDPLEVKE